MVAITSWDNLNWGINHFFSKGGGITRITLREILTVYKHNLALSKEPDFLHASFKLCILHAFFGFERIWAKARVRALFMKKYNFFDSKSILTSLNALEKICAQKIHLRSL